VLIFALLVFKEQYKRATFARKCVHAGALCTKKVRDCWHWLRAASGAYNATQQPDAD
jgi:hypothetical protein